MKTLLKFLAALVAAWALAHCAPPAAVQTAATTYTNTTTTSVNPEVAHLQTEVARLRQARGGETVGEALARAGGSGGYGGGMPASGYGVRMPISAPLAGMLFLGPTPWREDGAELVGNEVTIWFNLSGYSARVIVNGVVMRASEGTDADGQPVSASLLTSSGAQVWVIPQTTIADARARYMRLSPTAEQRIRIELYRSNSYTGVGSLARVCSYIIPGGDDPAPGVDVSLGLMGTCR